MSGRRLIKPPPATPEELIRSLDQRIRQLETKQTLRVGDWVVHSTEDGRLLATKPGEVKDVGNPVAEVVDLGALRGYVTESEVAGAITQDQAKSLSTAKETLSTKYVAIENAQYSADNANAVAARLDAQINAPDAGYIFSDSFNRPAADDWGPDYFRTTSGSSIGIYGVDGAGYARTRSIQGASARRFIDRHVVPTNTAFQTISAVVSEKPRDGGGGGITHSALHLSGWVSTDNLTRVEAYIGGNGTITIGYYIAGVYTELDAGGTALADGDRFDFWLGTDTGGTDPYEFVLLRNNLDILVTTDFGMNAVRPANSSENQYGAVGVTQGSTISFYVTSQMEAPSLDSVNIADRKVT